MRHILEEDVLGITYSYLAKVDIKTDCEVIIKEIYLKARFTGSFGKREEMITMIKTKTDQELKEIKQDFVSMISKKITKLFDTKVDFKIDINDTIDKISFDMVESNPAIKMFKSKDIELCLEMRIYKKDEQGNYAEYIYYVEE